MPPTTPLINTASRLWKVVTAILCLASRRQMSAQEGTDQDIGNVVVDQLAVGFFAQDNKRLAKRSEATAGTEWLYAHSAGADFVRRGDNVKNKKRLWLSGSLPPAQTGCAASLAPYRPALAEAQRC